jgi:hypothetical protein
MFDEKNIYVKQAEVKSSFEQNRNGNFRITELTVNSSLKNYKRVLHEAFDITIEELNLRNKDVEEKVKPEVKPIVKPVVKTDKKANVKGME